MPVLGVGRRLSKDVAPHMDSLARSFSTYFGAWYQSFLGTITVLERWQLTYQPDGRLDLCSFGRGNPILRVYITSYNQA